VQVDAATPGAVQLRIALPQGAQGAQETPQGTVYRAPAAFHVQTHHYCYPDTGIEIPLGALPVVECNRWEPQLPTTNRIADQTQLRFWDSAAGQRFRADVADWEVARATEQSEAAEAERLIAQSMAETPTIACQVCGNRFEEHELDVQMRCRSCVGANLQPRATHHTETP
jgi:DNA-directed RNA polymerase subunit RPC12/RpoP